VKGKQNRHEEIIGIAAWKANDPSTVTGLIRHEWESGKNLSTTMLPIGAADLQLPIQRIPGQACEEHVKQETPSEG
jgi:hypothetical protein